MEQKSFGKLADGEGATLYTISNTKGMCAQITDFGAAIVSLVVKDKNGRCTDISAADSKFWSNRRKKLQSYCRCSDCNQ